jgi:Lon protease-like protein
MNDLPITLPIFPLTGAILLPRGHLPLNIFEPRYKKMIEDAQKKDGIIGIIQPANTVIASTIDNNDNFGTTKNNPDLYQIGCAGLISNFEETENGQYFILLTGLRRFKITEEIATTTLYRQVKADYSEFSQDGDEADIQHIKITEKFFSALKKYLTAMEIKIDLNALEDLADEELINSLAMVCPFDAAEKQLLLECRLLKDRVSLMMQIMDFKFPLDSISSDQHIH